MLLVAAIVILALLIVGSIAAGEPVLLVLGIVVAVVGALPLLRR